MNNPHAIYIDNHGGTEMLKTRELELSSLEPHQIRIKHTSIGLNFIDTYHRSGLYPIPLPSILGLEAAGIIEQVGGDVQGFQLGDFVGYCSAGLGAYATERNVDADKAFKIPTNIPQKHAAAALLKGLTCEYLIQRSFPVQAGQTVLFHAITGGVGSIACQWLKQKNVTVIGTTSTDEKAEIAKNNGCDHVIRYDQPDWEKQVLDLTDGKGVPVVFDGVGKTTFDQSLQCLQPRGTMVSFGNASGAVDAVEPALLAQKGSLFLTRPILGHYVATQQELQKSALDFFTAVDNGLNIHCSNEYALQDCATAHQDLQDRKIIGQAVLIP